jgi:BASS family bile acid:Na+ symporter
MTASLFSTYLLPTVIGIIMLNLGLTLTLQDFKNIAIHPKPLIIGLVCQMILLPLIAFTIASISGLSDELKVGIIIIAACPGGATSNLITYLLKGNVPLSVSLTAVNSVLILFSIPAIIYIALQTFMDKSAMIELPVLDTILKIFYMIIIPTSIGILIRARFKKFAKRTARYMKFITTAMLAIVYLFVILESNNEGAVSTLQNYTRVAPFVFALNVVGMLTGYFTARIFSYGKPRQITLSVEVGIQNSALAITIASSEVFLGSHEMAIPALVYGLFTFFNAVLFGLIIKKVFRNR